jgi:hypothetical protein
MALQTDSRHADRLRSLYASAESTDKGFMPFKRIDFLVSRRSFEALKCLNRKNNSNVYELWCPSVLIQSKDKCGI